jgi:hypothetical protein
MTCTAQCLLVGGELKDSGTDGTREMHWRNKKLAQTINLRQRKVKAI